MKRYIPLIAVALILPVLIKLGLWQLDRASFKLALRQAQTLAAEAPPARLPESLALDANLRFRTIEARGEFVDSGQLLLDNRIYRGQAGYHVLTPLRVEGSDVVVLINRGWVSWGDDRSVLPDVTVPMGVLEIRGRAIVPPAEYFALDNSVPTHADGVWQNLDLAHYRDITSWRVADFYVELDPASTASELVRDWLVHDDGWVERHRAYAMQWFALALTLVIITAILVFRRRRSESGRSDFNT